MMSSRVLLSVCAASSFLLQAQSPADRELARSIYKELIEIKSGYSTGGTTDAAEAMAKRFRAAGFPESDIHMGGAVPHKGNIVVRYHGTGKRKPILLLAHL